MTHKKAAKLADKINRNYHPAKTAEIVEDPLTNDYYVQVWSLSGHRMVLERSKNWKHEVISPAGKFCPCCGHNKNEVSSN